MHLCAFRRAAPRQLLDWEIDVLQPGPGLGLGSGSRLGSGWSLEGRIDALQPGPVLVSEPAWRYGYGATRGSGMIPLTYQLIMLVVPRKETMIRLLWGMTAIKTCVPAA